MIKIENKQYFSAKSKAILVYFIMKGSYGTFKEEVDNIVTLYKCSEQKAHNLILWACKHKGIQLTISGYSGYSGLSGISAGIVITYSQVDGCWTWTKKNTTTTPEIIDQKQLKSLRLERERKRTFEPAYPIPKHLHVNKRKRTI